VIDFIDLAQQCAPMIHVQTMRGLVKTESGFNPFAIGVVNGRLERQPRNLSEAVATVKILEAKGYNYSVGYAQVNRSNFKRYGLTTTSAFQPCANLRAGGLILSSCFVSAKGKFNSDQAALRAALSCYYSGNFTTGLRPDFAGQPSYVEKVVSNATGKAIPVHRGAEKNNKPARHVAPNYVPRPVQVQADVKNPVQADDANAPKSALVF
jgi:type IV secretion system protein VirB1